MVSGSRCCCWCSHPCFNNEYGPCLGPGIGEQSSAGLDGWPMNQTFSWAKPKQLAVENTGIKPDGGCRAGHGWMELWMWFHPLDFAIFHPVLIEACEWICFVLFVVLLFNFQLGQSCCDKARFWAEVYGLLWPYSFEFSVCFAAGTGIKASDPLGFICF